MSHAPTQITGLLERARSGDERARGEVFAAVYDELRRAAQAVAPRSAGKTLQPTALVHEAWLKLSPGLDALQGRTHFLAVASKAMRQILADHARAAKREKRGGGWSAVALHEGIAQTSQLESDLVALDECLEQLAGMNARHARVVEMRVFGGLTIDETADELGVSHSTVESDWCMARAWLWRRLASSP